MGDFMNITQEKVSIENKSKWFDTQLTQIYSVFTEIYERLSQKSVYQNIMKPAFWQALTTYAKSRRKHIYKLLFITTTRP